jgi:hypothetical protein
MNESGDSLPAPTRAITPFARERAVEALTRGYAEDHLTEAELEERLDRVYRATTLAEIEALTAKLPVPASGRHEARAVAADEPVSSSLAPAPRRIRAVLSGHESAPTGLVPRKVSVKAVMGYVELDMRRATFEPGVTRIDLRSLMGYIRIVLPAGVRVESDGHALLGYFSLRGGGSSPSGGAERVVHITGRALLGYAECFTPSQEE